MKKFLISERYRLEVHWEKVIYKIDGIANIIGCYLSGPVISYTDKLKEEDFIDLDFINQYKVFIPKFYIARLSWKGVRYLSDKIYLSNALLKNTNVNVVPKLKFDDYITVDTKNHEDTKHQFYFTYPAYLLKDDGSLYNFGR